MSGLATTGRPVVSSINWKLAKPVTMIRPLPRYDQPSPFTNTLGWCFRHAAFQYDSNGDMTNDAPFPRCITLTTGDVVPPIGNPPHNDAQYFWCVQLSQMFTKLGGQPSSHPAAAAPFARDRLTGWN